MSPRRRTTTSNFGVGARENHDASGFYQRFHPPVLSTDDTVREPRPVAQPFVCGDARHMDTVADGSVALVVTSPPYFAGKQYEEELEREGVPGSYLEYLTLLADVFAECVRKLEPGGRIAVNVANLGRKPYRSLSADVIRILESDLGLLLRGEVLWRKAEGASSSCAWGSYRSPTNPVLRDVSERVVIASKGRFDRALPPKVRAERGLPHRATLSTDDFLELTLDVWTLPPESARRVGHPAPFPVELPEKLIRLYTFADDLVLDPLMGSGSTMVAAARTGRRYVGYDLDPTYVEIAEQRVAEVTAVPAGSPTPPHGTKTPRLRFPNRSADDAAELPADGGLPAVKLAEEALAEAGFTVTKRKHRVAAAGVTVAFATVDQTGVTWMVDVAGTNTSYRGGMTRSEVVWRTLGRAASLRGRHPQTPFLVLTTALPQRRSEGDSAVRAAGPSLVFDVVDLLSAEAVSRLASYAATGPAAPPLPGFWTSAELAR